MRVTITAADGTVTEHEAASVSFSVPSSMTLSYAMNATVDPAVFHPDTGLPYSPASVLSRGYTITEVPQPEFSL